MPQAAGLNTRMQREEKKDHTTRTLSGIVVSDKMKDTVVVEVTRFIKVKKYEKYIKRTKRYKAHDLGNTRHVGDRVVIGECRPISKDKRFKLIN